MNTSQAYAVNQPLTKWTSSWYAHAAAAGNDIAEFLAPLVQAPFQGTYKKYDAADAFLLDDAAAAAHTPLKLIDIVGEDVSYQLVKHGLKIGITDEESAAAGETLKDLERNKVAKLVGSLRRAHNWEIFKLIGGITAVAKTYTVSAGKPLTDLIAAVQAFELANGVKPNRLAIAQEAWNIIQATDEVTSELANNRTRRLTPALLAEILGYGETDKLEVRKVTVPYNTEKGNKSATNKNMMGSDLLLFYASDMPDKDDISAMKTLCLNGAGYVAPVENKYDDDLDGEYYRVKAFTKPVLAAPTAIVRWTISNA